MSFVHLYLLKTVYNDRPYISLYALRIKLAVSRGVTASDVDMRVYMSLLPTAGVGRRLRTKTSPTGPIIVNVDDLSPYVDVNYMSALPRSLALLRKGYRRILSASFSILLY